MKDGSGSCTMQRVHTTAKFPIIPDRGANKQQSSLLFHFFITNKNLSLSYMYIFSYFIKYFGNIITKYYYIKGKTSDNKITIYTNINPILKIRILQ